MLGLVLLGAGNSVRFIESFSNLVENNNVENRWSNFTNSVDELVSQFKESFANKKFNKIFLKINNLMVWQYSVLVFSKFLDKIDSVVFVLNSEDLKNYRNLVEDFCKECNFKNIDFVEGGQRRQDSVFNGIKKLDDRYIDYVLIHDLARPLIFYDDIYKLLDSINDYDGVSLYSLPSDSVCAFEDGVTYLRREKIFLVKTPQIFRKKAIINSHEESRNEKLDMEFTDDISLLDFYLFNVGFVLGSPFNFKITNVYDYFIVKSIINEYFKIFYS